MARRQRTTSDELRTALRLRCNAPEWALFFEVSNATGGGYRRSADAVAMNLWPSRGLAIHGFEMKVGRGDWMKELQHPEKAEEIAAFCDYWWVVAAPDIVKKDEVPETWGLLVLTGKKLTQVKEAKKMDPKEIGRPFVAALFRRAYESMDDGALTVDKRHEVYEQAFAEGKREARSGTDVVVLEQEVRAFKRKLEMIDEGMKEAGLPTFHAYDWPRIGKAVNLVHRIGVERVINTYTRIERELDGLRQQFREAIKEAKKE